MNGSNWVFDWTIMALQCVKRNTFVSFSKKPTNLHRMQSFRFSWDFLGPTDCYQASLRHGFWSRNAAFQLLQSPCAIEILRWDCSSEPSSNPWFPIGSTQIRHDHMIQQVNVQKCHKTWIVLANGIQGLFFGGIGNITLEVLGHHF